MADDYSNDVSFSRCDFYWSESCHRIADADSRWKRSEAAKTTVSKMDGVRVTKQPLELLFHRRDAGPCSMGQNLANICRLGLRGPHATCTCISLNLRMQIPLGGSGPIRGQLDRLKVRPRALREPPTIKQHVQVRNVTKLSASPMPPTTSLELM